MTTFIVILCLVGYVVAGGFTFQMLYDRMSGYDKDIPAFFGAAFWPLVGPIAAGKSLAKMTTSRRPSREERRRRAELEEAQHQEQLARYRLNEAQLTERAIQLARKDSL